MRFILFMSTLSGMVLFNMYNSRKNAKVIDDQDIKFTNFFDILFNQLTEHKQLTNKKLDELDARLKNFGL